MDDRTDEQLVAEYLAGDEKSLEILIGRFLKPIYSFVYRYVLNSQEAEDITQDVFIKVWRHLKKRFDPKKGKFKTWIFAIAKNASIDVLKRKKAVPFSEFENAQGKNTLLEKISDPGPLPDELFEQADMGRAIVLAMENLSPKHREVLVLRYNDHFTFQEIADILGESLHTVKSRCRRALAVLQKLFTN